MTLNYNHLRRPLLNVTNFHSSTFTPHPSSSFTPHPSASSSSTSSVDGVADSIAALPPSPSSYDHHHHPPPPSFRRAKYGNFFQAAPQLRNQWVEDPILSRFLAHHLPENAYRDVVEPDLRAFGDRVVDDVLDLHHLCEANPPRLKRFDAWGRRVDELITCEAWKKMKRISAEEGLVAIAYESRHATYGRLYQIAKSILFAPSSGLYSCPLSMTDGAAKIIGGANGMSPGGADLSSAYDRLTSRNPDRFWTSGQWMTERGGGSDVASGCETLAYPQFDGTFRLRGFKWFSSATDSDMAMTLARIVDADGRVEDGTRGLSMFYLEVNDARGNGLNNIEVVRLKNKLGTRQLPTAELLLDGTVAELASPPGRGVAAIAPMLTVTRLHNSLMAVSTMRRVVNAAKDYADKRIAFGRKIVDHPLHAQTLARLEVETRAATLLVLEVARHLGRLEAPPSRVDDSANAASTEKAELLLRILTPLAKLYTAKQAVAGVSECLESLGGQGYIEDTGFPAYLRDVQVLSIWEGTTNVLSLDVLRAMTKTQGRAAEAFFAEIEAKVAAAADVGTNAATMTPAIDAIRLASQRVAQFLVENQNRMSTLVQVAARDLAYSMTRIFMGALLVEFASITGGDLDVEIAKRWCLTQDLSLVATRAKLNAFEPDALKFDKDIVMDCRTK